MRDAGIYVRAPLKTFYHSLTDTQKAGFVSKQPKESKPDVQAADPGIARQYQGRASLGMESSDNRFVAFSYDGGRSLDLPKCVGSSYLFSRMGMVHSIAAALNFHSAYGAREHSNGFECWQM